MPFDEIRNISSTKKDLRGFGLTIGVVLSLIGGLLLWRERPSYPYFFFLGGTFVLCGLLVPIILKPLQKAWMAFSILLGWVMTRVILSVLFYLAITPLSLVMRLAGKDFLGIKRKAPRDGAASGGGPRESYWHYRESRKPEASDYERQF
jgi:hypothetical protein